MPTRWFLPLNTARPERVRTRALHAAVSNLLGETGEAHRAPRKPFAISPMCDRDQQPGFELSILDDGLVASLIDRLQTQPFLQLKPKSGPSELVSFGGLPELLLSETWEQIRQRAEVTTEWRFDLLTPLVFRSGRRYQPFPAIESVFGSLRSTWRTWCPQLEPTLDLSDLLISVRDAALEIASMEGPRGPLFGSIGSVNYRLSLNADTDVAEALDQCASIAPYAGIGAHTTMGFGNVDVSRPARTNDE